MIHAHEIFKLHDDYLNDLAWPENFKLKYQASNTIYEFIEANHFFNTKLWNEEDLARRKKVSDAEITKSLTELHDVFHEIVGLCSEKK